MNLPNTLQVNGITVPAGYVVKAVTNRLAREGYRRDASGTVYRDGKALTGGQFRAAVRRAGVSTLRGKGTRLTHGGKPQFGRRVHEQATAIENDGSRWARLMMPFVRYALPEVGQE